MTYGVTFRAALLASTASTSIGRLRAERRFGTPMHIVKRYAWVDPSEIAAALKTFCEIVGEGDKEDIEALSHQRLHVFQIREFERHVERLRPHPMQDARAGALRRFDAAQALFTVTPNKFDPEPVYPPLVASVMRQGGEALFELGREQCLRLAQLARELVEWAQARGHRAIAIVESPLGNCVPCAVIEAALTKAGVAAKTVAWGCPRNDRPARGDTVKKSAERFAGNPIVQAAACVLYVDDALTGTRFLKLSRALRSAVGADRFAGVAMRFPSGRGFKERDRLDLTDVDTWAEAAGLKAGVVDFPARELFVIDDGRPGAFEKEMIWADSDLVAGKRKVNLLFEMLDHLELIAADIISLESRYRPALEQLWTEDDQQQQFAFKPGLIDEMFIALSAELDVADLFRDVRRDARIVYANDYYAVAHAPNVDEIKARWDWLDAAILAASKRRLKADRADRFHQAVNAIYHSGVANGERRPDRDHDYGQYTIPWSSDLIELNRTLCRLIGEAV